MGASWHSWTSPYPTEVETVNTYTINDTALGQQCPPSRISLQEDWKKERSVLLAHEISEGEHEKEGSRKAKKSLTPFLSRLKCSQYSKHGVRAVMQLMAHCIYSDTTRKEYVTTVHWIIKISTDRKKIFHIYHHNHTSGHYSDVLFQDIHQVVV